MTTKLSFTFFVMILCFGLLIYAKAGHASSSAAQSASVAKSFSGWERRSETVSEVQFELDRCANPDIDATYPILTGDVNGTAVSYSPASMARRNRPTSTASEASHEIVQRVVSSGKSRGRREIALRRLRRPFSSSRSGPATAASPAARGRAVHRSAPGKPAAPASSRTSSRGYVHRLLIQMGQVSAKRVSSSQRQDYRQRPERVKMVISALHRSRFDIASDVDVLIFICIGVRITDVIDT